MDANLAWRARDERDSGSSESSSKNGLFGEYDIDSSRLFELQWVRSSMTEIFRASDPVYVSFSRTIPGFCG
jgi:hypothetical protein